ncbi:tripartite tricarboxylate transporter substrate binding protein [Lacisediminimonas sp.]|uniref:tripartite tricarboxylate transporter substrate binding protein n=1 Tax=Lacisediminimonas sp. TaxID=3060582 RepID=UPI0027180B09|nr:tripartite tricarboxylate transporter substrate binding protein [Lacisediminimonas sp.]MDO8298568.1 tripartite tricarboxylate transporter substrate binding protein [Lacisediminimonas sp.]
MKKIIRLMAVSLLAIATCGSALAQRFPSQPVKIIVPFPPGGTTDILARELSNELSQKWGVTVLVDNRGGASGTIGSEQLVRSAPDGYTLMVTATHHVINPSLYKSMKYDTRRDFTPIALVAAVPNVLVVHPSLGVNSVQELIKRAKEQPGKINFGSAGPGGANHLAGELFKHTAGIDIVHVPYKGAAPALNDLLGGQIPMMFDSLPGVIQHIQSGRLKALAVTTTLRARAAPEIPTMQEAGVKDFEATAWFGMYAPAKMPAELTRKLSTDVLEALKSPRVAAQLQKQGAEPGTLSQPDFARFVDSELTRWNKVITTANITLN